MVDFLLLFIYGVVRKCILEGNTHMTEPENVLSILLLVVTYL